MILKPFVNPNDDEWVYALGRFMINMGGIEASIEQIIYIIDNKNRKEFLHKKIDILKEKFPTDSEENYNWAMNVLDVAHKLRQFRNSVAHNPLVLSAKEDQGKHIIEGILDIQKEEIISLEELNGRINETKKVAEEIFKMASFFL